MSNFDSIQAEDIAFLDVGNSSVKAGIRKEDFWHIQSIKNLEDLLSHLKEMKVKYVIAASVRSGTDWLDPLVDAFPVAVLESADIPRENLAYQTPETLGIDRYLACRGAYLMEQKPVVVIDAGSACTIDYMDGNGVFQGGVIMPGLKALQQVFFGAAPSLPHIEFEVPDIFPGKSSKESLQWGLSQFLLDGILANLARYESEFGEFTLYLSGGDAEVLASYLNREVIIRADLIFAGMEEMIEG